MGSSMGSLWVHLWGLCPLVGLCPTATLEASVTMSAKVENRAFSAQLQNHDSPEFLQFSQEFKLTVMGGCGAAP